MQVIVKITKPDANVEVSKRTGKQYAQQPVGVIFPGEEYPVADKMLVELKNGTPLPMPLGEYTAEAVIVKSNIDFSLSVNYRTLKKVESKPVAKAA